MVLGWWQWSHFLVARFFFVRQQGLKSNPIENFVLGRICKGQKVKSFGGKKVA